MKYSEDFKAVINNGTDFDMTQICNCSYKTMNECEARCLKYHDCHNIAMANDILKDYENYCYEQNCCIAICSETKLGDYMESVKFDDDYIDTESGTTTLYFYAHKDILNGMYPEADSAQISVEFPTGQRDVKNASVEFSPVRHDNGYTEAYDFYDVDLSYEEINCLFDLAYNSLKKFSIPVIWQVWDKVEVKARSIEDAIQYVKDNADTIRLKSEPEYLEGSYKIDDGKNGKATMRETIEYLGKYWNLDGEIDGEDVKGELNVR